MYRGSLKIEVAGICGQLNLENNTLSSYVEASAKSFLSRQKPDFIVDVVPAPLPDIGEDSLLSAVSEGPVRARVAREGDEYAVSIEVGHNSRASVSIRIGSIDAKKNRCRLDDYSEELTRQLITAFFRTCTQFFLGRSNGFLFHAGGLVRHGKGFIFAGPSGSGKSTAVGQSDGCTVLSDDLVCLTSHEDRYYACGTPWHDGDENESAEIEKIFFLRQDEGSGFERLGRGLAALETLGNISANVFDSEFQAGVLDTVCEITARVPCYRMHFSLDEPFWEQIESLDNGEIQ